MSLGWLSEPAVLPSQSKEIPVDPSSSRELAEAVFHKETEARQYGAVITNRTKITTLRNQQKQFIENQNAAKRDEFIRQQNVIRNKQNVQQKINKYDSIIRGDSNIISNQYLVDFEGKGIDVTMEKHEITLMNARNERRNKNKINYDLYEDMVIGTNELSNKSQIKITFEDKMKSKLLERKKQIIDDRKQKQNFMEQLKNGNIESLLNEMNAIQTQYKLESRTKPIFTNKAKKVRKPKFLIHKKRKLDDMDSTKDDMEDIEQPLSKKFKSERIDKECGYAAIPPPTELYSNNKSIEKESEKESKKEAIELIQSALIEEKERFIPQQSYQHAFNANYQYNPYLHQYNPYMTPYQNMQYQYQYYNQQMSQYPYQSNQTQQVQMMEHNPLINTNTNNTESNKPADSN